MKRAEALIPLSKDHHKALVTAKRIADLQAQAEQEICEYWDAKREVIRDELLPHFSSEEHALGPLLTQGGDQYHQRLLEEHQMLVGLLAEKGSSNAFKFSELLKQHVRFEERELFPWLEANYSAEILERAMPEDYKA